MPEFTFLRSSAPECLTDTAFANFCSELHIAISDHPFPPSAPIFPTQTQQAEVAELFKQFVDDMAGPLAKLQAGIAKMPQAAEFVAGRIKADTAELAQWADRVTEFRAAIQSESASGVVAGFYDRDAFPSLARREGKPGDPDGNKLIEDVAAIYASYVGEPRARAFMALMRCCWSASGRDVPALAEAGGRDAFRTRVARVLRDGFEW